MVLTRNSTIQATDQFSPPLQPPINSPLLHYQLPINSPLLRLQPPIISPLLHHQPVSLSLPPIENYLTSREELTPLVLHQLMKLKLWVKSLESKLEQWPISSAVPRRIRNASRASHC
ncbi:hypothetical protein AAHA92_14736 [Salvia divinorum]|uniref:Uncharacterized protein n=1 Tax=Salvia divinorum TaxID=28513 RepID=A0ABD1HCH8_SALDI